MQYTLYLSQVEKYAFLCYRNKLTIIAIILIDTGRKFLFFFSIVRTRNPQKNFQLVVITHDEHFVELLSQSDFVEYYYRVAKDDG